MLEDRARECKRFVILGWLDRYWYLLLLAVSPATLQVLYPKLGFNPTDDGFILAYSRRILEGQIPHIDFISIRPVGSAILHLPVVLIGGEYTLYLSRLFVWFQLSFASVAAITVAEKLLKIRLNCVVKILLVLISTYLSAHTFPIMAWHTIDGIFLISLGLLFSIRDSGKSKLIGYFIIGLAYICKQNYLPLAFVTPFILGDHKRWQNWLILALPGLIYILPGLLYGEISTLISQLVTQSDIKSSGLLAYTNNIDFLQKTIVGLVAFYLLFLPSLKVRGSNIALGFILGSLFILWSIQQSLASISEGNYLSLTSFQLAGLSLGALIYLMIHYKRYGRLLKLASLFLLLAWSSSISLGYNSPALASGLFVILMVVLIIYAFPIDQMPMIKYIQRSIFIVILLWITWYGSISFNDARKSMIYRETPAQTLNYSLSGVVFGLRGIHTDQNTYHLFVDLDETVKKLNGQKYAIIPETAIYWVKSEEVNPLPIDWPLALELNLVAEKSQEALSINLQITVV